MLKPKTAGGLQYAHDPQTKLCARKENERQKTCLRLGFVQTLHHAVAAAALLAEAFFQLTDASLGGDEQSVKV